MKILHRGIAGAGKVTFKIGGSFLDCQLVTATVADTDSARKEIARAILAIA
jgi:hypothetical protein